MIDFGEKMIPFVGYIEPTLRCNHTCFYCYREKAIPAEKDELTRDEIKVVLDDMASLGTMILVLTGGEIFLRPDIFDIIEDARKRAFAVVLFTNGSLTDEKAADKIKELAVTSVEITVRAADAAKHDEITGMVGSFEKTVRAIRLLRERGVHVKMKCQIHRENMQESLTNGLRKLAALLDVKTTSNYIIFPNRDGDTSEVNSRLDRYEMKPLFCDNDIIPEMYWSDPHTRLEKAENRLCGAGSQTLVVSADGCVYPCIPMHLVCGSIRESSLVDVWHNSPMLTRVRSLRVADLQECRNCNLVRFCGRCTAVVYTETGELEGCSKINQTYAESFKDEYDLRSSVAKH